uniref:Uncharacterized protein n=1 Tax=Setaria digitata TaxID=48799 RepID=A0A915Q7I0_9BILA
MGDLVRDAMRATGIDEEVEQLIADAIVRSWNENHSKIITSERSTERKLKTKANEPNLIKVRIIAEQLWKRLERIYEIKLQTWKENEAKVIEGMVAKLRCEYKANLLLKKKQLDELAERKDNEFKNKEDFLREEIRMTFEKKKLECERAWREIETAQKELRFQKELLDNARTTFQAKKDNELHLIEQERYSLEQIKDALKMHEKCIDQRLREAVRKAHEKDKAQIAKLVVIFYFRQFFLPKTEKALSDALNNQQKTSEDLERIKKEKENLSEENQKLMERLKRRDASVSSLKRQLKLVEESAALRINDLKLEHRLTMDKLRTLENELRRYHSSALEKLSRPTSLPSVHCSRTTTLDSESSSTTTQSSSVEQHFRDRMKALNLTKQELDFSLEKLCIRSHFRPLDCIKSPYGEIHNIQRHISRNPSNHEIKNVDVVMPDNSLSNQTVNPAMIRYMKIIQDQREKVESPLEWTPKKENIDLSEESLVIETETGERQATSNTPSDFGW